MADSAYVWAPIAMGGDTKNFKPGDEVTRDDLPKGDFDEFLAEGVLRLVEFPENVGVYEAVRTRLNAQALATFLAATEIGTPEQAAQPGNAPDEPAPLTDT